jgi:hypothetical protein
VDIMKRPLGNLVTEPSKSLVCTIKYVWQIKCAFFSFWQLSKWCNRKLYLLLMVVHSKFILQQTNLENIYVNQTIILKIK